MQLKSGTVRTVCKELRRKMRMSCMKMSKRIRRIKNRMMIRRIKCNKIIMIRMTRICRIRVKWTMRIMKITMTILIIIVDQICKIKMIHKWFKGEQTIITKIAPIERVANRVRLVMCPVQARTPFDI